MRQAGLMLCVIFLFPLSSASYTQGRERSAVGAEAGHDFRHHIAQPHQELRVMSFNLRVPFALDGSNHWNARRDMVVRTIQQFDPDLLGTQECLTVQAEFLNRHLRNYDVVGAGRRDGDERGEMCAMFFRIDRFEKLDEGHFWLSNTPNRPGSRSWGSKYPRVTSWVKLRPLDGGTPFYWFNTHFDHRSSRARAESAKLLAHKIATIARGVPTIVTGDFNDAEASAPYRTLTTSALHLLDTFRLANPTANNDGTFNKFRGKRSGDRIDWILTCRQFVTLGAWIDRSNEGGRYPSDHFPVTAVISPVSQPAIAQSE